MTKKLALLVVVLFTVTSAVLMVQSFRGSSRSREKTSLAASGKSPSAAQDGSNNEPKETESALKERLNQALGTDDGLACAIFYAGDLTGNLETCG